MHILIVYISFTGVLFASFPLGSSIQKAAIILLLLVHLIRKTQNKFSRSSIAAITPFFLYLSYGFISAYSISGTFLYAASALLPLSIGIVFYFYIITSRARSYTVDAASNTIILLCTIQITFSIIKLFYHGIDEKILIGTMSHVAGQLGFLFPAVAVPLIFYFMKNKNQYHMWLLIFGLIGFGIINEKRSIVFLMPLIVYASILANESPLRKRNQTKRIAKIILISPFVFAGVFLGMAYIPSLNIGAEYGGAVNFLFAIEYAVDYLTMDYGSSLQGSYESAMYDENIQVGRVTLLFSIAEWLSNSSWSTQLFGVGFGTATPSEWLSGNNDRLFDVLGTRGAISGAGLALVETGIIGLGICIYFFLNLHCIIRIMVKRSEDFNLSRWYKTVNVVFYVFLYDFFFYSTALLRTLPMPIIFFAIVATLSVLKSRSPALNSLDLQYNSSDKSRYNKIETFKHL
jgi:hypothetical protein